MTPIQKLRISEGGLSSTVAWALRDITYALEGNISVTANVAPRGMAELCKAAMEGDIARAIELNNKLFPLHQKLFVEPNPVPVKWALAEMGKMPPGIRLPLVPLAEQFHETVRAALREAGVLN